jgi:cytochrome c oxidase assembly protein subunit 15
MKTRGAGSVALYRFGVATACATFILIVAGALVTSNNAGLSVPDWPLSYGTWMPPMVGGVLYEHSHRMIAATVVLLTIILNAWLWRRESRPWLRRLGLLALAVLGTQAILGGVTVLFLLPAAVSVLHAGLAQIFFCLLIVLVVGMDPQGKIGDFPHGFPKLAWVTTFAIFLQILLGAAVRHSGTMGGNKGVVLVVGVFLIHVIGAIVVSALVFYWVLRLLNEPQEQKLAWLMLGLLVAQAFLGVGAYLARLYVAEGLKPLKGGVLMTTSHVATGTMLLAVGLVLALRCGRKVEHGRMGIPEPASRL